jgi:hypothetical protein
MQILREVLLAVATIAMLLSMCVLRLPRTATPERVRRPRTGRRADRAERN